MILNPPQGAWASRPHVFLLLFFVLLLLSHPAAAQTAAPTLIPFQARLTNQLGEAYGSGQYTLTFNLYDQPVGGATVWTERHEKVGLINGMVNVFLGSISTFPSWQPASNPQVPLFSGTKYLGITVDSDGNPATADPEMVPRTMLVSAFYAQNAGQLAGFDWSAILQGGVNNPQTGTIRGDKLTSGSISTAQIAPGAVIGDRIADGVVSSNKLADGAISASKILDGSVTTSKIADNAITLDKIPTPGLGQFQVAAGGFASSNSSPSETPLVKGGVTNISELQVSLYASGRPIIIGLIPATSIENQGGEGVWLYGTPKAFLTIKYFRQELNPTTLQPVGAEVYISSNDCYTEGSTTSYPATSFKCFDTNTTKGKLYKYYLKFQTGYPDTLVSVARVKLYAHDL